MGIRGVGHLSILSVAMTEQKHSALEAQGTVATSRLKQRPKDWGKMPEVSLKDV